MLLAATMAAAGDFFTDNGILTNVLTPKTLDREASLATPGDAAVKPGVVRVEQRGNHSAWHTARTDTRDDCTFTIAATAPIAVGSVLVVGPYEVAFLAADGQTWTPATYPGDPGRMVRVVPLPPGTTTAALRLTAPGAIDDGGRYGRELALAVPLAGRVVNVAPEATLRVSSTIQPASGFRPDPRQADPETLLDGSLAPRNWASARRETPITAADPEAILLDWHTPRDLRGIALIIGAHESGAGTVLVQGFVGPGEPDETRDAQWRTIAELRPERPWRPPLCWEAVADFGATVTTRALRLLATAGLPAEQAAGGEGASPNGIALGEILVFQDLGDGSAPARIARRRELAAGVVPIRFHMPEAGKATIRIVDESGAVVRNLVSGESFAAGDQEVLWDLATIDDYWPPFATPARGYRPPAEAPRAALPGTYRWEGIRHPGLSLEYLYSYYPLKKHNLAWITADTTGGWLADHVPPQTLARVGDRMWVGTFCEAGHALLEADTDMRKLWGSNRIWLACPRVLAVDGETLYYLDQGGWVRNSVVMIQVDPATKRSRRLLRHAFPKDDDSWDIQGLAVRGSTAWVANRATNRILVLDLTANLATPDRAFGWQTVYETQEGEAMTVRREIAVDRPGRIRPYDATRLAVVSGDRVLLLDTTDDSLTPLVTGFTNPLGLAVDADRRLYVGEMAPSHQVKVFAADGTLERTFGKPGPHRLGAFDPDTLESPAAVEVDAAGNVWVCEFNEELKRTSVWDAAGHCLNQVLGPTVYGGGGDIDPRDENRFWYRGKEFVRDPKTGAIRLSRLVWRGDDESFDRFFTHARHNFGGASPAYPFYHGDQLFFTSWQGWGAGANTTLWRYAGDRVRPVGAVGSVPGWLRDRLGEAAASAGCCAWTDLNDDGRVQDTEVRVGPLTYLGKPWDHCGAQWQFRMNADFTVAVTDGSYRAAGLAWFQVEHLTPRGYPVWTLPTAFRELPYPGAAHCADAVWTDARGNAVTLDEYIVSMAPDGAVNWRYKNRWPGLHAGHSTSARGDEPGVVIAPIRLLGGGFVNATVGEVICIGSNLGATYLFTADGLWIDRAFQDCRVGLSWRLDRPPTPEILSRLSLGDEHFGGTLNRVQGADGQIHWRYVVGQPHCSVVELHGLDRVQRLPGGTVTVTADDLRAAAELRRQRAVHALQRPEYTIARRTDIVVDGDPGEWPEARIEGFALAYDDTNLYVLFAGKDDRAAFRNAATDNFLEAFKTGDVVDVKLETRAGNDPKRTAAAAGDVRLSFAEVEGEPAAILYDFVVPGTPPGTALAFASPWRSITIDRVVRLSEARLAVVRTRNAYVLEAAVPLAALHLDPAATPVIRGDVGRVLSDQTGTRAVSREYWSNKSTAILSDVPSEATVVPALWGTLRFE